MKRKVNKVGQNTLTVSLPRKWADEQHVEKGTELDVQISQNQITITAGELIKEKPKEITITLNENHPTIIRSILGAYYQKGYDLINVRSKNPDVLKSINKAVMHLVGFDVIDRSESGCVIKSYLANAAEDFNSMLSKMINTIKTSHDLVKADYSAGEYARHDEIEQLRLSVWKLRDLSMRLMNKNRLYGEKRQEYILILFTLEKINRNYKRLYFDLKDKQIKRSAEVIIVFDEVREMFNMLAKTLFSDKIDEIELLHQAHNRLSSKIIDLMMAVKEQNLPLSYLLENVRRMQDIFSPIVMMHD